MEAEGAPQESVPGGTNLFSNPNYWGEAAVDSPRPGLVDELGTDNAPVDWVWWSESIMGSEHVKFIQLQRTSSEPRLQIIYFRYTPLVMEPYPMIG